MHRKMWWSTARVAFVGGINYSADHLADFGPMAKQDYAVEFAGPLVSQIRALLPRGAARRHSRAAKLALAARTRRWPLPPRRLPRPLRW